MILWLSDISAYMIPCLNKKLLGFECLGCGLQRSVYALSQGDLLLAFKMYPAVYPLSVLFIALAANIFFNFRNSNRIINILAIVSVATILIQYILKLTL